MKRVFLAVVVLVATVAACSLNPQPFPPDNPDAAQGLTDASKGNDSSSFGDAAGGMPDASDAEPVPESDGGDAGDASDALIDVSLDAIDDVVSVDGTTD